MRLSPCRPGPFVGLGSGLDPPGLLELCPADDVLGRRWLVERLDVPFIADESVPTAADVTREVLSRAATAISQPVRTPVARRSS